MASDDSSHDPPRPPAGRIRPGAEALEISQTATGYWTVNRGPVQVASSMTRRGAEAERELLVRLALRRIRRRP